MLKPYTFEYSPQFRNHSAPWHHEYLDADVDEGEVRGAVRGLKPASILEKR